MSDFLESLKPFVELMEDFHGVDIFGFKQGFESMSKENGSVVLNKMSSELSKENKLLHKVHTDRFLEKSFLK